jgi:phage terminase large subunit GpA-like protein
MSAPTYPLFPAELQFLNRITEQEPEDPCEWIEEHLELPESSAYASSGPIRLFPWQKWLIRKALNKITSQVQVHRFIICSSVQVGKSFIAELIMCFLIRWRSAKIMLCYSTNNMVKRTVKERLTPLINANSELYQYKTGIDDDFSMEYLTFSHGTIRVASAEAESTIASFAVPYVIASELSKYPNTKTDIGLLLEGRKNFYEESGKWLIVMESSPKFDDDTFGKICSSAQVQLYPHVKLPCGHWCYMEDRKIEGLKGNDGETIQNPELIKSNVNNAWLVCPQCQHVTYESEHASLLRGQVIWACSPMDIINDVQPDYNFENIAVNMNKFLNSGYHFNDCLSEFFKCKNALDGGISLRTWQNESMGRATKRIEETAIKQSQSTYKPRKLPYTIYNSDTKENKIPLPAKFLLLGADTQVNLFCYSCIYGTEYRYLSS